MFRHEKIQRLDDFFTDMGGRRARGSYFYRINSYDQEVDGFIRKYYEAARTKGAVIEGRIPNPDEKNLAYYREMMGDDFRMDQQFITERIKKWLPRMNDYQVKTVSVSIYEVLVNLQRGGKNENMLKNAYIKFMCWMYYKFEQVLSSLGNEKVPKILYEGAVSNYELLLLAVLSTAGCDIVLLQYAGDQAYLALDPNSGYSEAYVSQNAQAFPQGFCIKQIRETKQQAAKVQSMYGPKSELINCTNAWLEGNLMEDIIKPPMARGEDPKLYYNCFGRINGVEDKLTYVNQLFQMYLAIKNNKRHIAIVEGRLPKATTEEISKVKRGNYPTVETMIQNLALNFKVIQNLELQKLITQAFLDVCLEASKNPENNTNRLLSKAVTVICYMNRYYPLLFSGWKTPDVSCFILLGYCDNDTDAMFLKMLSGLPTDVLILNPSMQKKCCLEDKLLYEQNFDDVLNVEHFPVDNTKIQMGTAAFHAERELDHIMYDNTGMYRNQQYQKARSLYLQTMYEEIEILWKEELKYRPNFAVNNDVVNLPVIFAKVSGVKNGQVQPYWTSIRRLVTEDTILIKQAPYILPNSPNPMKVYATEFFKNGRLQKEKIKNHPNFPYAFLREEMQNHMLDKIQQMIDEKVIKGTFENGMEYTVVSTALNLPMEMVRLIQKFDFTKKNPKLVYINTAETAISAEDSIVVAFLSMIGFDVIFFVPTGYQNVERHYNTKLMEEHQIGDYVYDLQVPNLNSIPLEAKPKSWFDKILKRGT